MTTYSISLKYVFILNYYKSSRNYFQFYIIFKLIIGIIFIVFLNDKLTGYVLFLIVYQNIDIIFKYN